MCVRLNICVSVCIQAGAHLVLMHLQEQVPLLTMYYTSDLFSFTVHNSLVLGEDDCNELKMLSTICKVQL